MTGAKAAGEMNDSYNKAFRAGNIDHLLGLYAPEAILVCQPDAFARGRSAKRKRVESLLFMKVTLRTDNQLCIESGDLALLICLVRIGAS